MQHLGDEEFWEYHLQTECHKSAGNLSKVTFLITFPCFKETGAIHLSEKIILLLLSESESNMISSPLMNQPPPQTSLQAYMGFLMGTSRPLEKSLLQSHYLALWCALYTGNTFPLSIVMYARFNHMSQMTWEKAWVIPNSLNGWEDDINADRPWICNAMAECKLR